MKFRYSNPNLIARVSTGYGREEKTKYEADFNTYMTTFNNYFNANEKIMSITDAFKG